MLITLWVTFLVACGTSLVETEQDLTSIVEADTPVSPQASPSLTTSIETTLLIPTTELATQTPTTIPYTSLE